MEIAAYRVFYDNIHDFKATARKTSNATASETTA